MGCCGPDSKEIDEEAERHRRESGKGPLENRSCRDIIWLIIFVLFWVGMLIIAGYSFDNGDWRRLAYGVDSFGNVCGFENSRSIASLNSGLDMREYSNLYYHYPVTSDSLKLCIASCPTVGGVTGTSDCSSDQTACLAASVCLSQGNYQIVSAGTAASTNTLETSTDDAARQGCPSLLYSSSELLGLRRCVPSNGVTATVVSSFYDQFNGAQQTLDEIFADFKNAAKRVLYCCLIAVLLAVVIIALMRCFAGLLIWGLVLSGLMALTALCIFLFVQWKKLEEENDDEEATYGGTYSANRDNETIFKYLAIVSVVVTVVIALLVLVLRNRIRLVVSVFKEASRALTSMPLLYLAPLFTYILMAAFFVYWIFVYLYLASSGSANANSAGHVDYEYSKDYTKMWWYHLFGLFWTSQFILACEDIVIAGAIATWYFTRNKSKVSHPFGSSIYRLIRYHLGSAAFGAFIIALIQMARAVLAYIQKKLKGKTSRVVRIILCCLQCCLWCFEKFMKFINKNAYIEIAIYGYSFCKAARTAFMLLIRNILRVAAINTLGSFALFMCKLLIVCLTGAIGLTWLRNDDELHYYSLVLIVICVFAFYIADTFLDLYKMAIDTIFLSFLEDCEKNNGKDKPYFMSDNLLKFMKSGAKNNYDKPAEEKGAVAGPTASNTSQVTDPNLKQGMRVMSGALPPGYTQPPAE